MDLVHARDLAQQLVAALAEEAPTPQPVPPPQPPPPQPPSTGGLTTATALDAALSTATAGATILVAPSLVYQAHLTLRQSVVLSCGTGTGRMAFDAPAAKFLGGISVKADGVTLFGLEVRSSDQTQTLVDVSGAYAVLDRCRLLGDPVKGQKRGIAANGAFGRFLRCYVDDCFGPYPGDDCQAFYAQSTPGPLLIEDCYLSGGTETLMIGGGDPVDEAHLPSDITIRRNTITKNPRWQTLPISVKNTVEFKNIRRALIEDNDISYSWGGHGQDGYLLMLTVRNQDGRAPYSTVQDVTIKNNRFAHGAAAVNVLALDNILETHDGRDVPKGTQRRSVRMQGVTISGNTFTDLDPVKYTGSHQMIQIQRGPLNLTIEANTFSSPGGLTSAIYFDGQPKCDNLIVRNNVWPTTKYGVFGSGATVGKAWDMYVASGVFTNNG